jgi:hypothetical protein
LDPACVPFVVRSAVIILVLAVVAVVVVVADVGVALPGERVVLEIVVTQTR